MQIKILTKKGSKIVKNVSKIEGEFILEDGGVDGSRDCINCTIKTNDSDIVVSESDLPNNKIEIEVLKSEVESKEDFEEELHHSSKLSEWLKDPITWANASLGAAFGYGVQKTVEDSHQSDIKLHSENIIGLDKKYPPGPDIRIIVLKFVGDEVNLINGAIKSAIENILKIQVIMAGVEDLNNDSGAAILKNTSADLVIYGGIVSNSQNSLLYIANILTSVGGNKRACNGVMDLSSGSMNIFVKEIAYSLVQLLVQRFKDIRLDDNHEYVTLLYLERKARFIKEALKGYAELHESLLELSVLHASVCHYIYLESKELYWLIDSWKISIENLESIDKSRQIEHWRESVILVISSLQSLWPHALDKQLLIEVSDLYDKVCNATDFRSNPDEWFVSKISYANAL
ncbi:MAG: hypothetical protein N0C86_05730, partial [Candidatus Thiodiazotropha taylori]|nr:hypothetical protein [Candidatus Thiodiazotropha taylori]MCW4325481.1 hypothetical protein [Candidatus Thiodiazotropha taylori]